MLDTHLRKIRSRFVAQVAVLLAVLIFGSFFFDGIYSTIGQWIREAGTFLQFRLFYESKE